MRRFALIIALSLPVLVSGCIRPYKIDIQQGNVVSTEQLEQLKRGMTKREVRYLLGTPLVVDPFHNNRWDYYYSFKAGRSKQAEHRRITIVFDNEAFHEIQGDVIARESGTSEPQSEASTGGTKVTEPQPENEKGMFRRGWDKLFKK
jgi:outer membrane protein assembly factor BamE